MPYRLRSTALAVLETRDDLVDHMGPGIGGSDATEEKDDCGGIGAGAIEKDADCGIGSAERPPHHRVAGIIFLETPPQHVSQIVQVVDPDMHVVPIFAIYQLGKGLRLVGEICRYGVPQTLHIDVFVAAAIFVREGVVGKFTLEALCDFGGVGCGLGTSPGDVRRPFVELNAVHLGRLDCIDAVDDEDALA